MPPSPTVAGNYLASNRRFVRVGEREVEVAVRGNGSPTIVLEAGLGDDVHSWVQVFGDLSSRCRTLAYSRAGLGRSTPSAPPRNLSREATELRDLLEAMEERPPYVLVGHSWGGLVVQAFASGAPGQVAGLVLVDSAHPDLIARIHRDTPADGLAFNAAVAKVYGPAARLELDALSAPGGGHFIGEDNPYSGPTIILGAWMFDFNGSSEFQHHHRLRVLEIAERYPQAELRRIHCAHRIQEERPLAVIEAVDEVLARARSA